MDLIASRTHDPVALKTYTMRRLAVATATHVHRQLHGRARGHVALAPAAQRAADPGPHDMVEDDVTEQTDNADDVMAVEDGLRGGLEPHDGRSSAGAASGGGSADGRTWAEEGSLPLGAGACCAGANCQRVVTL